MTERQQKFTQVSSYCHKHHFARKGEIHSVYALYQLHYINCGNGFSDLILILLIWNVNMTRWCICVVAVAVVARVFKLTISPDMLVHILPHTITPPRHTTFSVLAAMIIIAIISRSHPWTVLQQKLSGRQSSCRSSALKVYNLESRSEIHPRLSYKF